MILFVLYTGQRLGDIATLRWNNLDLARGELRLSAFKTGKAIVLPLAASLRKHMALLLISVGSRSGAAVINDRQAGLNSKQGQLALALILRKKDPGKSA
jgi:integrase